MEKQKLIDSFNKNSMEIVKVQVQDWKYVTYVDIRSWLLPNPQENGSELPTHKGLTLRAELLPELIRSLEKAQKEIEKRSENVQDRRSPGGGENTLSGKAPEEGEAK